MGFADDWAKVCKRAGDKVEDVTRKAMVNIADDIIKASPVDTGRFRGNWIGSVGGVNKSADFAPDKSGNASLRRVSATVDAWKPGQTVYITNSLSYALPLEYGHSKQAPGGMVRLAVQRFEDAVRKAAQEVK